MDRIVVCFLLLSIWGCVTYKKCEQKYGTVLVDTNYVDKPISVIVPRDSVRFTTKTDTTTLYREIVQGRAKVIYSRTHERTIVQAECKDTVLTKIVRVPVVTRTPTFGVHPYWRQGVYALIALLLGSWLAVAVRHFFVVDITRRITDAHGDTNK